MESRHSARIGLALALAIGVATAGGARAGVFDQIKELNENVKENTDLVKDVKQTGEDVKDLAPEDTEQSAKTKKKKKKKKKNKRGDAAASEGGRWHVETEGKSAGPYSTDDVGAQIASGQVGTDTLVWQEGMSDWVAARNVPEFRQFFARKPPPLPGR